MEQATAHHKERLASLGAVLYAENCVVCHGQLGQGVVGPPLFTEGFRGDPDDNTEVYDMLYRTIENGRPGTTDPRWVKLANGHWASYTAMPAWGNSVGGPYNDQHLAALTHFIMDGDWAQVGAHIPSPAPWVDSTTGEVMWNRIPDGVGISAEASQAGKEIFVNRGCVACHTLGSVGGYVGPDLTKVGEWGLDREFLSEWIRNPQEVEHRAPQYWSNYGGPYELMVEAPRTAQQAPDRSGSQLEEGAAETSEGDFEEFMGGGVGPDFPVPDIQELPPSQMPALGLTDEEIETLVDYLLSLR